MEQLVLFDEDSRKVVSLIMENLIKCSRILYDKTISDKMKKIYSLKTNLKIYEKPTVFYSTLIEWTTAQNEAYEIIKKRLAEQKEAVGIEN